MYDKKVDGHFILNEILEKYSFLLKTDISGPSLDTNSMKNYIKEF